MDAARKDSRPPNDDIDTCEMIPLEGGNPLPPLPCAVPDVSVQNETALGEDLGSPSAVDDLCAAV